MNRYGTHAYRNWRAEVHRRSMAQAGWHGSLVTSGCSVRVRYFWHLDRRKDVDNILKAIFDGLDGKSAARQRHRHRVLEDDCEIEHVTSQRTKIDFSTRLSSRALRREEYLAALDAIAGQASVYVSIRQPPDHSRTISR